MTSPIRAGLVVLFTALTVGGLSCTPEPQGTPCTTVADCGAAPDTCVENTCVNQQCGTANVAAGTRVGAQLAGDCKVTQCDGAGHAAAANDDSDFPVDAEDCTDDVCTAGVPSHPPRATASACGAGGLLKCDGQGRCVTCTAPADCGASSECQARTCVAGTCGANNAARGTALATQAAGDCQVNQCDGAGATERVADDADVRVDATTCTRNVCTAGVPSNPPVTAGTTCTEGTGTLCDGAGACVACVAATDCPGTDGECQQRTCTAGVCGVAFTAQNTPVASQTARDCQKNVCDGAGAVTLAPDAADLPNDNNACTVDTCVSGTPTFTNATNGTSCGTAGVCGAGVCVGCNAPTDCPGTDDECKARTCVANVCGVRFTAANTAVAAQTLHDCKQNACDGSGNVVNQNDNADLPADDGNQCTSQVCTNGAPGFPAVAVNTACTQNGGAFCSTAGACVACTAATQCPGSDTQCQVRTCTNNVCGLGFTAVGFVTTAQTPNDCQENRCNGAGAIVAVAQNTDLPVDDGNLCTSQACVAGAPSFPPTVVNSACGPGGGSFCNGAGTCVGCTGATQCPGSDTECQARTCTAGACGFGFAAAGSVIAVQAPADCHLDQCNGAGAVVTVIDNSDVPLDDGNQCTAQVCSAGVPSHPFVPSNTACNQNGGSFCSGAGACVSCTTASQCPGSDSECRARTCTAGACGTTFTPAGTSLAAQTAGDCQVNQCDGSGNVVSAIANGDLPADDGNQCTHERCTAGVASHPALAVDSPCNQLGGSVCSPSATCVACNAASQCPGTDTECQARSCTAGACGFSFAAAGSVIAVQTPADCRLDQCDGAGAVVTVIDNSDVPLDDGNQCTAQVCSGGVPSHPFVPSNTACNQNGGSLCNGVGACVTCTLASQCPGSDTECQARTCTNNVCGFSFAAAGSPLAVQTAADCRLDQCDGAGAVVNAIDNSDVPLEDGNQCTAQVCNAGVPGNPFVPVDTACNQNGGSFCSGSGACVGCTTASQCPGSDTECRARTCTAGACGTTFTPAGTSLAAQTVGDCQLNQCDGSGNVVTATSSADVPADDGNQCTTEVCAAGVPSHPALAIDSPCSQLGGSVCSAGATCVACNVASQCPGADAECQVRACTAGACGFSFTASGVAVAAQTSGDCRQSQCNGAGAIVTVALDTDVPVDSNQCTDDVCAGGVPINPVLSFGQPCNQNSGTVCDGSGSCVLPPQVASTSPADSAMPIAAPAIAVTFNVAMNPATLTGQTTAGACSGSLQVSMDGFASCIAFSTAAPTMSGGNTTATLTAAPSLLVNQLYKLRVTTAASSATGLALAAQFTHATGFITTSPNLCNGSLVISQVYGGGGLTGATYKNDFVELHNRGTTAISLAGLSLQYTSTAGNTWSGAKLNLTGSVAAGGYFLVQLASTAAIGATLPTADQIGTLDLSGSNGKLALVNSTLGLAVAICPDAALTIDSIGYGTANCSEGSAAIPALSATTSAQRVQAGCGDVNRNASDFAVLLPAPRNSATANALCSCSAQNESNAALEADYCTVQFPLSLSTAAGAVTAVVYGQLFETGTTEAAGANANVRAQLGYGLPSVNPQYGAGWTWTNATFNVQTGNNDEYQASFTAPTTGGYRYAYRFSLDQGVSWTYCDQNAGDSGSGSNANLSFELNQLPVLTVP